MQTGGMGTEWDGGCDSAGRVLFTVSGPVRLHRGPSDGYDVAGPTG
jgi:hypothetical protein